MFDKDEIKKKSAEFNLEPADVERDYIQSWIIREIAEDAYLGPLLTFKGSGALRKLYYPETRFARDLDFSAYSHVEKEILIDRLQQVGKLVQQQTGVPFVEEVKVRTKNLPEKMEVDALEARMYFKGIYSEGKFDLKTRVDITRGEHLNLPPDSRSIIHPYSDASSLRKNQIRCQKLEEIIATKFITLMHRQRPGDFWDLVYSTFISNENEINRGQVIRALLARTNFANSIDEVRQYFLQLPLREKYAETWNGLLIPVKALVSFEDVEKLFLSSITNFFDEVASQVGNFISGTFGKGTFSDAFREKIIGAGRRNRLVKLTYSDKVRDVEPYRLEYYTPESDGRTKEYLWGFDRSGGTSQTISIKRFICDNIQEVEETNVEFMPQWDVEL